MKKSNVLFTNMRPEDLEHILAANKPVGVDADVTLLADLRKNKQNSLAAIITAYMVKHYTTTGRFRTGNETWAEAWARGMRMADCNNIIDRLPKDVDTLTLSRIEYEADAYADGLLHGTWNPDTSPSIDTLEDICNGDMGRMQATIAAIITVYIVNHCKDSERANGKTWDETWAAIPGQREADCAEIAKLLTLAQLDSNTMGTVKTAVDKYVATLKSGADNV